MVKTNYNSLNPAVSQALIDLQYRYSDEMPEIWCSLEKRSFYIYCTVCDALVFIHENTIECANHHLNECIAKTAKRRFAHSNPVQKKGERSASSLSSDEVNEIFMNYSVYPQRGYRVFNMNNGFREKIAYSLFNSTKIIQRAWRAYKLRPETWAKQVWNMVRNDGYNYPLPGEYKEYYLSNNWIEKKKEQLNNRWTYMLKWLSNPEYYRINGSSNERIVRSLEYAQYMCKIHGKSYLCNSLKINYFETKYLYILEEEINIDFSDSNNNC
ncbi:1964_t:CDS:2, partial [Gigaspora margarita]